MVTVHVDLRELSGLAADAPVPYASLRVAHYNRIETGGYLLVENHLTVKIIDGVAEFDVMPTPVNHYLVINEDGFRGARTWYTIVPNQADVDYVDLPSIDPATLESAEPPEPAWTADVATNVVGGEVIGDDLWLERRSGATFNAGDVRGPTGLQGPPGAPGGYSATDPALGFVGDGTTNNAAAWNALEALMTGPTTVWFPKGVYKTVISGLSVFQPVHDVTIVGEGPGTQFTTDAVTANSNLISPAAAINLTIRQVRATGSATGANTPQFVNTSFSTGTSKWLFEDVIFDGAWAHAIKAGGGGTEIIDIHANRCVFDLTVGTGIINNAAGGRIHVDDCEFPNYGLTASNQWHGIYCYQRIALRVRNTNFYDCNGGTGRSIQHFGSTGDPEYSDINNCYFGPNSGAFTSYVKTRVVQCRIMGTSDTVTVRNDIDLIDCTYAGTIIFGGDAAVGSNLRIRGGESTVATALVTSNVAGMVINIEGHSFRGLASTATNPLAGSQIASCTRSMSNVSFGPTFLRSSTTANRPSAASFGPGGMWQDTTLGYRVFSDGTNWKNASGVVV